jgi:protein-tyrosine phosphatase
MPWPFSRKQASAKRIEVPEGLIDLHCHALHGVDDGPAVADESHAILDGLAELGYRHVVLTPHYNHPMFDDPDRAQVAERAAELQQARGDRPPEISIGAEIMVDERFVEHARAGDLPSTGALKIHLIEFAYGQGSVPSGFEELVFRLQTKGITLIIAHAERYPDFQRDQARLEAVSHAGALIQINLMSLSGRYSHKARRYGWELVESRQADLGASDLHHAADLLHLRKAIEELARVDREQLVRLVSTNPQLLLEGKPFELDRRD